MELILTHEHADFDAIASQLAVSKLIPEARPLLGNRLNRNVRHFMRLYWDVLPFMEHKDLPSKEKVSRAILVDTQTIQNIRGVNKSTRIEVIDHHTQRSDLKPEWMVTIEQVGATTTMLVERIQQARIVLTPIEATLLALGIYEDTGSLSYGTTTPRDVFAAGWLLEQGATLDVVRDFLHQPLAEDQRGLYEALLESAESIEIDGHPIVIAAADAAGLVEEIATVAHKLRDLLDPSAIFLLVNLGSHIQLVARSSVDAVHVGTFAEGFGGGGHSRAAAAVIRESTLDDARAALLEMLPRLVQPSVTVRDLMSYGVQTLSPLITAEIASEQMRKYGYEGFPVLENGQLVGLLTRRAVDRALDHGLTGIKIGQIMEAGTVSAAPDDSLNTVQQMMMSSGWGQIPVMQDERIIGVVTRTDVIKHLGLEGVRPSRRVEVAYRMESALPPVLMALVREIGRVAREQHLHLYVVGGFARDLMLGLPTGDMDFVVEGDAIALTRAIGDQFGGQTRAHGRFGTGKWMISGDDWKRIGTMLGVEANPNELPSHLDFVTARREFYEAPTVLPEVELSSIKHDLHRRDFTINTLAISLDPSNFGELLDFYGGESDLKEGRIRVLHSLSFVDDPTRIMRAVRLEQRLGFHLGPRTKELLISAIPLMERVSGDRVRHEIELMLDEARPEDALCRLESLGVLQMLHSGLRCDDWLRSAFEALRYAHREAVWAEVGGDFDIEVPYFALLTYRMPMDAINSVGARIRVQRRTLDDVEKVQKLKTKIGALATAAKPSEIDATLRGASDEVLITLWAAAADAQVRDAIVRYAQTLRHVMPETDGEVLKARGLKPSRLFSRVLGALRVARLDGEIRTSEEEIQMLEHLLTQE